MFFSVIVPFLLYLLILFVAFYVVTEYGHYNLYDEGPPGVGWRVLLTSVVAAALLTVPRLRLAYDTMFTSNIHITILHGIVWFGLFLFVLRFHPPHAAGLAIATLLVVPGLAGMAVDSATRTEHRAPVDITRPNKAYRAPMPTSTPAAKSEPAKVPAAPATAK